MKSIRINKINFMTKSGIMKSYKVLLFVLIFSLLYNPSFSQDDDIKKSRNNELSIVIDDIFAKSPVVYLPYYYLNNQLIFPYYNNNIFNIDITTVGLSYKHHFGNSGIRTKLSLGSKSQNTEYSINNNEEKYSYITANLYLGYEWLIKLKKLHIFYGAEIFVNHDKLETENIQKENYYRKTENSYVKNGYGANPLLGVKYYIVNALSVSTEIKYLVEFYKGENTYKDSEASEDVIIKNSGMITKFGPLGQLSVNIHF